MFMLKWAYHVCVESFLCVRVYHICIEGIFFEYIRTMYATIKILRILKA